MTDMARNSRSEAIRRKKCRTQGSVMELPGGLFVKPMPRRFGRAVSVLTPSTHVTPATVFGGR